ncbi:MAG: cytochrome c biogenesis protein CcsA [Candidatus Thorarchaeota archaeon]
MQETVKRNRNSLFSFLNYPTRNFYSLIAVGSFFLVIAFIIMYVFTPPFPTGPGGFNVSGHPVFYMISEAFVAFFLFTLASISSLLFLIKKDLKYDTLLVSAAKTGILASALTLLIGIFWSKVEWGYYWQWEPRETMTLIMFIFYVSIILFRGTVDDIADKAKLSAVFGLVAFPTVPMTNFIVGGLHPSPQQTAMSNSTFFAVILMFIGSVCFYIAFLYMTWVLEKGHLKIEEYKALVIAQQDQ